MNVKDRFGYSILCYVCKTGNLDLLSFMLEKGLDLKGKKGPLAFYRAVNKKRSAFCHRLLDEKAGINASKIVPLLKLATDFPEERFNLLEKLLKYPDIEIDQIGGMPSNALYACVEEKDFASAELLLKHQAIPILKIRKAALPCT